MMQRVAARQTLHMLYALDALDAIYAIYAVYALYAIYAIYSELKHFAHALRRGQTITQALCKLYTALREVV